MLAGVVNTFTLVAASGYTLPTSITMTKAGSAYTGFTYDSSTGIVSIPSADITGSFNIEASAIQSQPAGYNITVTGTSDKYYTSDGFPASGSFSGTTPQTFTGVTSITIGGSTSAVSFTLPLPTGITASTTDNYNESPVTFTISGNASFAIGNGAPV